MSGPFTCWVTDILFSVMPQGAFHSTASALFSSACSRDYSCASTPRTCGTVKSSRIRVSLKIVVPHCPDGRGENEGKRSALVALFPIIRSGGTRPVVASHAQTGTVPPSERHRANVPRTAPGPRVSVGGALRSAIRHGEQRLAGPSAPVGPLRERIEVAQPPQEGVIPRQIESLQQPVILQSFGKDFPAQ